MRDLNPSDIDRMISVRGMVTRSTPIIPELAQARFQCAACHNKLELQYIDNGRITEPGHCSNCTSAGTMVLVHNLSKFTNKQQLRMQARIGKAHAPAAGRPAAPASSRPSARRPRARSPAFLPVASLPSHCTLEPPLSS